MIDFGFDSAFLQKLERLSLLNRRPLPGPSAGPRRSPRRGSSVEFADFRNYAPGDDFRRVDWNAFARLDRLFLRLYSAEEMTTVTIFLDHSPSVLFRYDSEADDHAVPPALGFSSKALAVARVAAVLSFIALHNYDRVAVAGWGDRIDRYLPVQSGKSAVPRVWETIGEIMSSPASGTNFAALRDHARFRTGSGLAIVVSDFLTDSDWRAGVQALRATGQEVSLVQVLAPEELDPTIRGDWALVDVETGATVELTVSPRLLRRYQDELAAHTAALQDFARHHGVGFVQLSSDAPIGDVALKALQSAGVVR